jgi:hypothetical protein
VRVLVTLDGEPFFHGVSDGDRILVAQWLSGWFGVEVVPLRVIREWLERGDDLTVLGL